MRTIFEEREYQKHTLDFIKKCADSGENVILEMDCGMGKRVITLKVATEVFPKKKILIILHSTSSLDETVNFFKENMREEFGWISSKTPSGLRAFLMRNKRVIAATPSVVSNVFRKNSDLKNIWDVVVINEVDKLIKRISRDDNVLVNPWKYLINSLKGAFLIGMSGTLRDEHIVLGEKGRIRRDIDSIISFMGRSKILTMDELLRVSDTNRFIKFTEVIPVSIEGTTLNEVIRNLDDKIYEMVRKEGSAEGSDTFLEILSREGEPVRDNYIRLTLLRKYIVSMTPKRVRKYFMMKGAPKDVIKMIPSYDRSPKIDFVVDFIKKWKMKVVVLASFKNTLKVIKNCMEKIGIEAFLLTGDVINKGSILRKFKESESPSALMMSPVGERDLDLSGVDSLIVMDTINTVKTMYQRMKRIRGGKVIILYYGNTSEESKVKRLLSEMRKKYGWSIKISSSLTYNPKYSF
ncbi:MAG: DEAD/DEAH box helicase [Candidatus Asgardarchaeia archaeon]